jgi:hypothetical protein
VRREGNEVIVGVPLRRDIDIADVGLGLGLGLGGQSISVSSEPEDSGTKLDGTTLSDFMPSENDEEWNRSSFHEFVRLMDVRMRGFRPLSSTFFRALMPTQSVSCFIAWWSERGRRESVRRLLVRVRVRCGVNDAERIGVENWWG